MAITLEISQILLHTFNKANPLEIDLPADKVWKIESIGIAGANGTVFLQDHAVAPVNLAILFSTIDKNDYGAKMPFWIKPGFQGWLYNDSSHNCAVSITEYDVVGA